MSQIPIWLIVPGGGDYTSTRPYNKPRQTPLLYPTDGAGSGLAVDYRHQWHGEGDLTSNALMGRWTGSFTLALSSWIIPFNFVQRYVAVGDVLPGLDGKCERI